MKPLNTQHLRDLRSDYEIQHRIWMNTSIFTKKGKEAKKALEESRANLLKELKDTYPQWIII